MSRLRSMTHRRLVGGGGGGGTGGVAQRSNFVFEGFIRLPTTGGLYGVSKFDNAGFAQGLAFNPAGNGGLGSLFVAGVETDTNIGGPVLAEVTIPTPGTTRLGSPTAAFLSPFYSQDEGAIDAGTPRDGGNPWHAAITRGNCVVYNSQIYDTWYINYDGSGVGNKFVYRRPVNLATVGSVQGPLGPDASAPIVGGSLAIIPPAWQSVLGNKKMLSGMTGVSIISRCSQGPSLYCWDPADSTWASGNNLTSTALAFYPYGTEAQWLSYYDTSLHGQIRSYPSADPWVEPEPFWSGATYMGHGLVVLDTFKTVLHIHTCGLSRWQYGLGIDTYYPGQEAQGIYPPNPQVEVLPPASWDNTTSGQLASTNGAGTRITIPFLTFDNDADDVLPIDQGRTFWLKSQTTPINNLGSKCAERRGISGVIGKGNKGLSNAYVDVATPYTGNLTTQQYRLGKPTIFDPANLGQGNHAPPYRTCAYAYNIDDLAAVYAGTKTAYSVLPYALWDLTTLIFESGELPLSTGHPYMSCGTAIDHTTKRIFMLRPSGDPTSSGTAIISVFKYQ